MPTQRVRMAQERVRKRPDEIWIRPVAWPSDELAEAETLSSFSVLSVTPSGALTATALGQSGQEGQIRFEAGDVDTDYRVLVQATTSNNQTLEGEILVQVRD